MISYFGEKFFVEGQMTLLFKLILTVIIIIITKIVVYFFKRLLKRVVVSKQLNDFNNSKKINSVISIFSSILKYIFYFIAVIVILRIFGINSTSLIATAGVGGIIVAFGVQSIIKDLLSGVFILFDDQYNVGDDVIINGISGQILAINMRNTLIKGYDGSLNTISNGTITMVTNLSKNPQRSIVEFYLPIDSDLESVKKIIHNFSKKFEKNSTTLINTPTYYGVMQMGTYYFKIGIVLWSKNSTQWTNEKKFKEELLLEFKKNKVDFLRFEQVEGDKFV
ncbi:MAG: mechanosensitive ion channel [Peptoniphilaceae bacterium]|uniref:mechanosensitive ion channel family protein n=1 Tax=Parvimonas sp. TaxID=1944660 RepID=UPI0025EA6E4F|nr:mechanosensitive ion channel domain-containing protein [Parvimonas sp.]MCI5998024.1 mechanosensitive ion channel family protein [Parvimonas sp.]MDD7764390.1 mechanosensitive ion channel [Peptoniphilaceae bacterium]MDY3051400.1 mechanosensitive ion channel [Parvimonas sp.]